MAGLHGREKKGAQDVTLKYHGYATTEYVEMLLRGDSDNPERAQVVPFLSRYICESDLNLSVQQLHDVYDAAAAWLEEIGSSPPQEQRELARDLIQLVTVVLVAKRRRAPDARDLAGNAMDLALDFAKRVGCQRENDAGHTEMAAAAVFILAAVFSLEDVAGTSDELLRLLLPGKKSFSRPCALRVAPFVVGIAAADAQKVLGAAVAAALEANDEELVVSACETLPLVLERFGPVATGLTAALDAVESLPRAASQPDVSRGSVANALKELLRALENGEDLPSVELPTPHLSGQRVTLRGFDGVRRVHFVSAVFKSHLNVPPQEMDVVFGTALERSIFWRDQRFQEDRFRDHRTKQRELGRGRARDAKHEQKSEE